LEFENMVLYLSMHKAPMQKPSTSNEKKSLKIFDKSSSAWETQIASIKGMLTQLWTKRREMKFNPFFFWYRNRFLSLSNFLSQNTYQPAGLRRSKKYIEKNL
jgi:hypothetical protein